MMTDKRYLDHLRHIHDAIAGLIAIWACVLFFIPLRIGLEIVHEARLPSHGARPEFVGWIFVLVALLVVLVSWTLAGFVVAAGRRPLGRTSYIFCLVLAGIECLFIPFGTVLGLLTIVLLRRGPVWIIGSIDFDRNRRRHEPTADKAGD